jgi:hypothetical protein
VGNGEYKKQSSLRQKLTRDYLPHNTVNEREGIHESYSNNNANAILNRQMSKLKTEK